MSTVTNSQNDVSKWDRDARTKWAKETINKKIPKLLEGDPLARSGVRGSTLIRNLPPLLPPDPSEPFLTSIHIWQTDTLTAAHRLRAKCTNSSERVAILNMASPLRPGGGVLWGCTTQEEHLCTRTTLYPSLRDEFYRLPEVSVIYTKDALVFRNFEGQDLPKSERIHVDVVTAAMLRNPDLTERDGVTTWADPGNEEIVIAKMRLLMRALVRNNVKRVVLGAWGCGAYHNPAKEVARLWRLVLAGNKRGLKEKWDGVEEICFAITDRRLVSVFKDVFDGLVADDTDTE
ncbi:hypothetical protein CPB86DRAFT_255604 [Serendipita vermifera]|nr:hypothetical protein CPB86DRAFT_255604 [Serendipita vermifera]